MGTRKKDPPHWIILLLEDDEDDYILIRETLYDIEDYQITLHWLRAAEEAINTLCEGRYDAALIDHHLGEHNGIEIIRTTTSARCTETPLILMSGIPLPGLEQEAVRHGAAGVLTKDAITCNVLRDTLQNVIHRHRKVEE
jgi:CheY-like chemotaxis protein